MSFPQTHNITINTGAEPLIVSNEYTGSGQNNLDEDIADSTTNGELNWNCDISAVKAIAITSDREISIYTNDDSGGSPDDTLVMKAGEVYEWNPNKPQAIIFTVDVTAHIFVTNASGGTARLRIFCVYDTTPA